MSILGTRVSNKSVTAAVAVMVCLAGLLPVWTKERTREIVLVATDMAFRLESDPSTANPVITVAAGESVRIVLKNRDRGMAHDFSVPALGAAMDPLKADEQRDITFEAPAAPGTYEYVCRPHSVMMKGTLRVTK